MIKYEVKDYLGRNLVRSNNKKIYRKVYRSKRYGPYIKLNGQNIPVILNINKEAITPNWFSYGKALKPKYFKG